MSTAVWPIDAVDDEPLYSAREARQSLMAPLLAGATAARPLGARSGVRPGTSVTTVTATSTTWTCGAHAGVLDVQTAAEAGPYGYSIDAEATGAVTAANATNPRVDIVYVQLSDPAESDGTTTPGAAVGYLAGTAAATPAAPSTPDRSMVLAQINVPKSGGGDPSVTWSAPYAVAAGGVIPVRTSAELTALESIASADAPVLATLSGILYVVTSSAVTQVSGPAAGARTTTASQTITTSAWTQVVWHAAGVMTGGASAVTGGVQVTRAGVYAISCGATWVASGSGRRGIVAGVNGAMFDAMDGSIVAPSSAGNTAHSAPTVLRTLAAGDIVNAFAYQDSGSTLGGARLSVWQVA